MERIKAWWHLWWDETLIIIGVSTVICVIIWGGWFLFQTMPLPMETGTVVKHHFTAQYEEWHDGGSTCWSHDKYGACTFSTKNADIHHVHCRGGCYEIQVSGCSNDRRGKEHCRKEWKDVNQAMYDNCRDGRKWIRGKTECLPT